MADQAATTILVDEEAPSKDEDTMLVADGNAEDGKHMNPQEASGPAIAADSVEGERTATEAETEAEQKDNNIPKESTQQSSLSISNKNEATNTTSAKQSMKKRKGHKLRKRGRRSRLAAVAAEKEKLEENYTLLPSMPQHHYEVQLRRRAVRKQEEIQKEQQRQLKSKPSSLSTKEASSPNRRPIFGAAVSEASSRRAPYQIPGEDSEPLYDEEVGDISLGMKLNM